MLALNQFLMLVSTSTALSVLLVIDWWVAMLSLMMNLLRRGRDLSNVLLVTLVALSVKRGWPGPNWLQ
jgi:uncharacterized membrane protein